MGCSECLEEWGLDESLREGRVRSIRLGFEEV